MLNLPNKSNQIIFLVVALLSTTLNCISVKKYSKNNPPFTLTSPAFAHNGMIPGKFTGDGDNISPALQWQHAPHGTQSFALIVDDPDAGDNPWVHWLLFNIPASTSQLPEGVKNGNFVSGTTNFYYTRNGIYQYAGPFPPSGTHHYHFTLYALDTKLNLNQDAERENLEEAMKGHILGSVNEILSEPY